MANKKTKELLLWDYLSSLESKNFILKGMARVIYNYVTKYYRHPTRKAQPFINNN